MRGLFRQAVLFFAAALAGSSAHGQAPEERFQVSDCAPGIRGGHLVVAERAEPRTLNPIFAMDVVSREITGLLSADLIHVDHASLESAPALARSWNRSADGKRYVLNLRRGTRFSDGHPFDADDVLFTFRVHLDD